MRNTNLNKSQSLSFLWGIIGVVLSMCIAFSICDSFNITDGWIVVLIFVGIELLLGLFIGILHLYKEKLTNSDDISLVPEQKKQRFKTRVQNG